MSCGPFSAADRRPGAAAHLDGPKCAVLIAGSDGVQEVLAGIPEEVRFRTSHLGVRATVAAFRHGGAWLRDPVSYLDGNRHHLGELLTAHLPTIRCRKPEVTYLAWLDCRDLGLGGDPAAYFP